MLCPATSTDCFDVGRVTIDMLPDVYLLEIFNFYMDEAGWKNGWHTLVHVCQKSRNVVFGSPRRLNLQLLCSAQTVHDIQYTCEVVWPTLTHRRTSIWLLNIGQG